MKRIIYIIFIIIIIIFILIGKSVLLNYERRNFNYDENLWQPYQVGDVMTFFNNKGDTSRWYVTSVKNTSNPSDPILPLSHRIYSTFVGVNKFSTILSIHREQGKKNIYFEPDFNRGDIHIVEKEKNQINLDSIKYKQLDLFKITPHKSDLKFLTYVNTIYWSPQYGYIKVFYGDGVIWELKSFERNRQIIYEFNNLK